MASRGPYWYVTVSLLQYIGKPFQARTGVFFDKSLQACRITLFNWSRLPSRRRDRIRQESIIEYHGKGHLSRKILILLRFFLRASAPLCWLMEYSFRKKKRNCPRDDARAVSFACCQGPSFSYVNIENHNSSILNWFLIDENAMVIKSSVFHYLLHRFSPGKLVDQFVQLAHLQNAKSESRRSRRNQAFRLTSL